MSTTNEDALNAELSRAFQQMHALNVSITTERKRGNVAGVQAMLPLYEHWLNEYKRISAALGNKEFTAFDRFVLDTGKYVGDAVDAIPGAIGALPSAIGEGLIKAALPFAVLALAWLYFRGKL
jgi:hypothetical protein